MELGDAIVPMVGDPLAGIVSERIRGGLWVELGVGNWSAFLPSSQVDPRRPEDIGTFVGRVVFCEVIGVPDEADRRRLEESNLHCPDAIVSRRELCPFDRSIAFQSFVEYGGAQLMGRTVVGFATDCSPDSVHIDLGDVDGICRPATPILPGQTINCFISSIDHHRGEILVVQA